METLWARTTGAALFPQPPTITSRSQRQVCPECGSSLKVYKTRTRSVVTLHIGAWNVRETLLCCNRCPSDTIHTSETLAQLVPPRCTFGYDVLVYVGRALFQRFRTGAEVREELAALNVVISTSEIQHLGRTFITYLAVAHRQRAPHIRQVIQRNGGYFLHLDGTCEGASPMLMVGIDSITEVVLDSVKIPTERTEYIVPFLKDIRARYGDPVATVRDMGPGIGKAIREVFPRAKDFICHFHFLRDIGKDLLAKDYDTIRKRLRKHGVRAELGRLARSLKDTIGQNKALLEVLSLMSESASIPRELLEDTPAVCAYALIQWTLAGANHGDGYGFPFDRPHLEVAKRIGVLEKKLQAMKDLPLRGEWRDNDPFRKTLGAIYRALDDRHLRKAIAEIERKIKVFDALRDAMRLAPKHGSRGLNDSGTEENMKAIEKAVTHFRQWLTTDPAHTANPHYAPLIGPSDKYWEKLFADPILVNTPAGPAYIQPQRTNNIMETFFRDEKQGIRRRTGNARMSKTLQTMLADTPLVKNLDNPQYMEILLKEHDSLEQLFAHIDRDSVRENLRKAEQSVDRVPVEIQKIIACPAFPESMQEGYSKLYESLRA